MYPPVICIPTSIIPYLMAQRTGSCRFDRTLDCDYKNQYYIAQGISFSKYGN